MACTGETDLPAVPKAGQPYYFHPFLSAFRQPCLSVAEPLWTVDGVAASLARGLLPTAEGRPDLQTAKPDEVEAELHMPPMRVCTCASSHVHGMCMACVWHVQVEAQREILAQEPWLRGLVERSMNATDLDVWGVLNGEPPRAEDPVAVAAAE